jgi:hypothetical protein
VLDLVRSDENRDGSGCTGIHLECSLPRLVVVDFYQEKSPSTDSSLVAVLHVLCVDPTSHVRVLLQYPCVAARIKTFTWLEIGAQIDIVNAFVVNLDVQYCIMNVARHDRTHVSRSADSDQKSLPLSVGPTASVALAPGLAAVLCREKASFEAIRSGKTSFPVQYTVSESSVALVANSLLPVPVARGAQSASIECFEDCHRSIWLNVTMDLSSVGECAPPSGDEEDGVLHLVVVGAAGADVRPVQRTVATCPGPVQDQPRSVLLTRAQVRAVRQLPPGSAFDLCVGSFRPAEKKFSMVDTTKHRVLWLNPAPGVE